MKTLKLSPHDWEIKDISEGRFTLVFTEFDDGVPHKRVLVRLENFSIASIAKLLWQVIKTQRGEAQYLEDSMRSPQ